jgi:hypothetical protein
MELTEQEKDFLISLLKGEVTWTTCMLKEYPLYQTRKEILESVLFKLGQHPFKTLLENNSK